MEKNNMNLDFIQKLAEIVADKNLGEITIQDGNSTITVKGKKTAAQTAVEMMPVAAPMPAVPAAAPTTPQKTETSSANVGTLVKAPIVGTFYAASAPDQPPFIKVGDTVKKGDVLFIIESMKLMNEVQSEVEGVVKEILVGNGEAVEYDQPILRVE